MSGVSKQPEDNAYQMIFDMLSGGQKKTDPSATSCDSDESIPAIHFDSFNSDRALMSNVKQPTAKQINERDKQYTELLAAFVSISRIRNRVKEWHKWIFFWLVIAACVVFLVVAIGTIRGIMDSRDPEYIVSAIPIVVAAFASLVTAVIGIPLAITNFLFNTKEDDNITEIIKHTQEHDAAGRNLFKDDIAKRS
ncbi:MAG: hypothetical protein IKS66_00170 [Oscillospiraceae bacterium]|nr:hypothetical protein [Oscillospiraceae bacterium]